MGCQPWSTEMDRFLAYVLASRLVPSEELNRSYAAFQCQQQEPLRDEPAVEAFCTCLCSRNLLTPWQGERLQNGQWKGFFFGRYRLLELVRREEDKTSIYLAREGDTGKRVELTIIPPSVAPLKDGLPQYRITECPPKDVGSMAPPDTATETPSTDDGSQQVTDIL